MPASDPVVSATTAVRDSIGALLVRELRAVQREIDAYPDEASVWRALPGVPNTGGTLALHLAGNIQHFVGAILARDGYVRDRDAEFARRDVPRSALRADLDRAIASVQRTIGALRDDQLLAPYPEPIAKRTVTTPVFLLHLLAHLAYHLGQIDVHRRAVSGDERGIDAVSVRELPEVR
ncbi:MAG TPA: DinB family protein [Gemmatimonadaceae bacterium]|nr:DinB family protein [Gemmatimonadaceae bacterium]